MNGGWRYRLVSVVGTALLASLAVSLAHHPLVQSGFRLLPVVGHLPFDRASDMEFAMAVATTAVVLLAAMVPLYKPRPRRTLDTVVLAAQRTVVALFALAAVGYFDYSYRLPRATLLVVGGVSLMAFPALFVAIRRQPADGGRMVVVGDDPTMIATVSRALDHSPIGYVSSPGDETDGRPLAIEAERVESAADGGSLAPRRQGGDLSFLGGLSRLDDVLVDNDVDTAVLAFRRLDRGEFFGTLHTCYEHGVDAKVHRTHADPVVTDVTADRDLFEVELEPWDWQETAAKRAFDVAFAAVGLLVLSPLILVVAVAIRLVDGGPVLFAQERTAEFGDRFTIYKFRTMKPTADSASAVEGSDGHRVTRVGRLLRRTHLDEIPQLWQILVGEMSVVGPRPVWTDEEARLHEQTTMWPRRWFVKPGLTGLAQVEGVGSETPNEKLQHDIEYIRRQSLWFDTKIVVRQLWLVLDDVVTMAVNR